MGNAKLKSLVVIVALGIEMVKMVQVSDECYGHLMFWKGILMTATKRAVTFDDVIANEFNKANHLGQIISRLIRKFPEERERIAEIAKETNAYEDVKAIIETVGKSPPKV